MSRTIRKQLFDTYETLLKGNHLIKKILLKNNREKIIGLLTDCQSCAIAVGTQIEEIYGTDLSSIHALETYCEMLYQITEALDSPQKCREIYLQTEDILQKIKVCMESEIPDRIEAVFLPYKVSMWDSLESVWMAAAADADCDAYVVPIPYYDKGADGSFEKEHYEGNEYPDYVPVTHYNEYNFEQRHPDLIFIHNPYDQYNNVTSVHPFFYSSNLKQFTDCLIYIPYYSTAGGMSEGQSSCSAYYYADYIVIQAEKYRKFFDPELPADKLLPLGSPKFDKVIRRCQNPPEPPAGWKEKMEGKKVYFYNTSIGGMLGNTTAFLKKMEYVFKCFAGRKDACLIWRPHPLLESTFTSMRESYKPVYDALKKYYLESDFGIYDDTPEITDTIALCDAYIGDSGTSVTSLFGLAGKPLFILNNNISSLPDENDWRGEIIKGFYAYGNNEWMITQGNKLYRAKKKDYHYNYFCDLTHYASGDYYLTVIQIGSKNYVCPANAQDVLVIGEHGIEERIKLKQCMEQSGAFYGAIAWNQYLFLIPNYYPYLVCLNTETEEIRYLNEHLDIFAETVHGERKVGGYCVQNGYLFLASPIDNQVLVVHAETGNTQILTVNANNTNGCMVLASDGSDLWLMPYMGTTVIRWNPEKGIVWEYSDFPETIICKHPTLGYECLERPFAFPAFVDDKIYLAPLWGDKYMEIDKNTHEIRKWQPPFEEVKEIKNGYFLSWEKGSFICPTKDSSGGIYLLFSDWNRKLYEVNPKTRDFREIEIVFNQNELQEQEPGFMESSQWLCYCCEENALNSLKDFLDGTLKGFPFDKERQIQAFGEIARNHDGTSGEKIYRFLKEQI